MEHDLIQHQNFDAGSELPTKESFIWPVRINKTKILNFGWIADRVLGSGWSLK